ncbi:MAG TPA: phytoene desaturase family protein [Chitinophagales bacterium]|nr:phytoene desaturase family protein [Chitinophagales bacterium]
MKRKNIVIIGSGFAGLSAACLLAKDGHKVTILEKNEDAGGRARVWKKDGFTFDMGPSWYWMPDVFEKFFNQFGKTTKDFYDLKRLDPSYRIYYTGEEKIDVPASFEELLALFESREKGSGEKLRSFLADAKYKYHTAMNEYVHRISDSVTEFFDLKLILKSFQLQLFQSLRSEVRKKFTNPALVSLLEFPVLFLGSTPDKTPAMYSMMNYADLVLGTWYPMGGMNQIVQAMLTIAKQNGVTILVNQEVTKIEVLNKKANRLYVGDKFYTADVVISGGDYNHTEQFLLDKESRVYDTTYWDNRTMSPSSLLFYVGVNKKLTNLLHHNLFFDADFELHAEEIYANPKWPTSPLFYVCAASKTDSSIAPEGMENLFFLMPLAPGIKDTVLLREKYFQLMLKRVEQKIGESFKDNIILKRSYCITDFVKDYHSYKGNAYGLANTLMQTAIFKPKMISNKVTNLFYTGQLTVPGPGVPPSIISGEMVAREVNKRIKKQML